MAMDFSKNRFFFPVGSHLVIKPGFETEVGLPGGPDNVYKVVQESHLPDEENGCDLEVKIVNAEGKTFYKVAHAFIRDGVARNLHST